MKRDERMKMSRVNLSALAYFTVVTGRISIIIMRMLFINCVVLNSGGVVLASKRGDFASKRDDLVSISGDFAS